MNVRKEFAFGKNKGGFKKPFPVFPTAQYSASFSDSSRLTTPAVGRPQPQGSSSGKRTLGTSTSAGDSFVILAITEGRGNARGEVGMACMDIMSPSLTLCQLTDCNSYIGTLRNINVMYPDEILMPSTLCDTTITRIYNCIRGRFPNALITPVHRKFFNDVTGKTFVKRVCSKRFHTVQQIIDEKFYALCATAALMTTVEKIHNVMIAPKTLKIEYQNADFCALIDFETAYRLELVEPLVETNLVASLFGVVNHCITRAGARRLRANILQPFCKKISITTRHEGITELVDKPFMLASLQSMLKHYVDVHKLMAICHMKNLPITKLIDAVDSHMNTILHLKKALTLLPMLYKAVEEGDAGLFATARDMVQEPVWTSMLSEINKVIADDIQMHNSSTGFIQRCYAVKEGVNHLLDIARKGFSERVEDLRTDIKELGETHSLDLRMNYSNDRGFHIVLHLMKGQSFSERDLPAEFDVIQKNNRTIYITTVRIMGVDDQLKGMQKEIQIMSNTVLIKLLDDMRQDTTAIYCFIDLISELDVIQSLAVTSSASNYVKPRFGPITEIIKGVHPILEHLGSNPPVPNTIKATDYHNFFIITGPNSSGKSVFIRQIALLQILAQIGSFVPAEKATFRICDKIFSRLGFEDNIELNASSYVVEMTEMNYILNHMTRNSLIIVDELCRGTSETEGSAMAWSICEEIMLQMVNKVDENNCVKFLPKPFVFFTTHFPELTEMAEVYHNFTNLHLEAIDEKSSTNRERLRYTHVVKPGKNNIEDYGIKLAGASNVLPHIVANAKIILDKMKENVEEKQENVLNARNEANKKLYNFGARLIELIQTSDPTKEEIVKIIEEFKQQNPELEQYVYEDENDFKLNFNNAFKPCNASTAATITKRSVTSSSSESKFAENLRAKEVASSNQQNQLHNSADERNIDSVRKTSQNLSQSAGPSHTISRRDYENKNNSTQNDQDYDLSVNRSTSSIQNSFLEDMPYDSQTSALNSQNYLNSNNTERQNDIYSSSANTNSVRTSQRSLYSLLHHHNHYFENTIDANSNKFSSNFNISDISAQDNNTNPEQRTHNSDRQVYSPLFGKRSGAFNDSRNEDISKSKNTFEDKATFMKDICKSNPDTLNLFSQGYDKDRNQAMGFIDNKSSGTQNTLQTFTNSQTKETEFHGNAVSRTQSQLTDINMSRRYNSPMQDCRSNMNTALFSNTYDLDQNEQTEFHENAISRTQSQEMISNRSQAIHRNSFDNNPMHERSSNMNPALLTKSCDFDQNISIKARGNTISRTQSQFPDLNTSQTRLSNNFLNNSPMQNRGSNVNLVFTNTNDLEQNNPMQIRGNTISRTQSQFPDLNTSQTRSNNNLLNISSMQDGGSNMNLMFTNTYDLDQNNPKQIRGNTISRTQSQLPDLNTSQTRFNNNFLNNSPMQNRGSNVNGVFTNTNDLDQNNPMQFRGNTIPRIQSQFPDMISQTKSNNNFINNAPMQDCSSNINPKTYDLDENKEQQFLGNELSRTQNRVQDLNVNRSQTKSSKNFNNNTPMQAFSSDINPAYDLGQNNPIKICGNTVSSTQSQSNVIRSQLMYRNNIENNSPMQACSSDITPACDLRQSNPVKVRGNTISRTQSQSNMNNSQSIYRNNVGNNSPMQAYSEDLVPAHDLGQNNTTYVHGNTFSRTQIQSNMNRSQSIYRNNVGNNSPMQAYSEDLVPAHDLGQNNTTYVHGNTISRTQSPQYANRSDSSPKPFLQTPAKVSANTPSRSSDLEQNRTRHLHSQGQFQDMIMNTSQTIYRNNFVNNSPLQACSSDLNPQLFSSRLESSPRPIPQTSNRLIREPNYKLRIEEIAKKVPNPEFSPLCNKELTTQQILFDRFVNNLEEPKGPSLFQNMVEKFSASKAQTDNQHQEETYPMFETMINRSYNPNMQNNNKENRCVNSISNKTASSSRGYASKNFTLCDENDFQSSRLSESRHQDLEHGMHSNAAFEQDTIPFIRERENSFSFELSQTPSFTCARTSTPIDRSFVSEDY